MRSHQSPRLKPTHAFAKFAIVDTSLSRCIRFRGQQKDSFVACKTAQTVGIQSSRLHVGSPTFSVSHTGTFFYALIIALYSPFVNEFCRKNIVIFYTIFIYQAQYMVFVNKL